VQGAAAAVDNLHFPAVVPQTSAATTDLDVAGNPGVVLLAGAYARPLRSST